MKKQYVKAGLVILIGFWLAGCNNSGDGGNTDQETSTEKSAEKSNSNTAQPQAEATLKDTDNKSIGTVSFLENGENVEVKAQIEGLEPGHHGIHIHENGVCETDASDGPFTTAGGHFNPKDKKHSEHAGDMPSLYVNENGQADYSAVFDRITLDQLTEGPLAVVIHSNPDNFGNIPDRYQSEGHAGSDEETAKAGDAGDRQACGVIKSTESK